MTAIHALDTGRDLLPTAPSIPAPGTPAWVQVRPDVRRGASVAADLLCSLGKNLTWHGKGRNEAHDVDLVISWIDAMNMSAIVVVNAQEAPRPTLDTLRSIATTCSIPLWLLYRAPIDDATVHKLTRMATTPADIAHLPLPVPAPPAPEAPTADDPAIPAEDFVTFHAALLREPDTFDAALAIYQEQLHLGRDAVTNGCDSRRSIEEELERILRRAPQPGELLCRIRAMQVIAWQHDRFLDVDTATLFPSLERPTVSGADLDTALLGYRQPQRAIVSALTLRGIPAKRIAALTISDATECGALPALLAESDLTGSLRTAITAQRHLRLRQGGQPMDYFLEPDIKTLARFVNDATTDLGVNIGGRRVERDLELTVWLRRLGLTLRDLA